MEPKNIELELEISFEELEERIAPWYETVWPF